MLPYIVTELKKIRVEEIQNGDLDVKQNILAEHPKLDKLLRERIVDFVHKGFFE